MEHEETANELEKEIKVLETEQEKVENLRAEHYQTLQEVRMRHETSLVKAQEEMKEMTEKYEKRELALEGRVDDLLADKKDMKKQVLTLHGVISSLKLQVLEEVRLNHIKEHELCRLKTGLEENTTKIINDTVSLVTADIVVDAAEVDVPLVGTKVSYRRQDGDWIDGAVIQVEESVYPINELTLTLTLIGGKRLPNQ